MKTKVFVSEKLIKKVEKKFKNHAKQVFGFMKKLEINPEKGKLLAQIGGIQLKELKYDNSFRFYFFSNGELIKAMDREDLQEILIKFVEMSKKGKEQQEIIDKLKKELKECGFDFF